jgi:hypothetical protein
LDLDRKPSEGILLGSSPLFTDSASQYPVILFRRVGNYVEKIGSFAYGISSQSGVVSAERKKEFCTNVKKMEYRTERIRLV